jgi:hypothetical protein
VLSLVLLHKEVSAVCFVCVAMPGLTPCTTRCHVRTAVLMSVTRRLSLDEAACRHCESTRIRPLWSLPRCVCHRSTKPLSVTPHHCVLPSVSASAVCAGPACSRRSLSHTPQSLRQCANHHCTDRIRVDARLALSPASVRGGLVLDMRPAIEWGVRVGVVAPTAAAQRAALVDLYIATDGNAWTFGKTGWQDHATGSDPCDNGWSGVTACSGSSGSANRGV